MTYDEQKFKVFNESLKSDAKVMFIHHPQVIGDNYEELYENLERLATARMLLKILPPGDR